MNVGTDSYTLKMLDAITGPLRRVESQMERVAGLMERMQGMAGGGGGGLFSGMTKGTIALGVGIGVAALALKGLVDLMVSAVSVAGQLTFAFGRTVLQTIQFRAQNINAMDTFFGKGQGEGIFRQALKIGGIVPADERDVVAQVRELGSAGFNGMGLSRANAALLDVGAMQGKEEQDNLRYYFRKFYGGRKVEADDLRMASFSAGLTETDVMQRVLKGAGVTPNADTIKMGAQFDALKKQGKIGGQAVISAILDGISDKLDEGGPLGSAAKKMGMGTLSGLISNLEAAPMRFLAEMKLESLPGIKSLMDFIKRLLPFFDHATDQGKKMAGVVEKLTNALFKGLDRVTDKDLDRFFTSAIAITDQWVKVLEKAWDLIDKMLHGNFTETIIEVERIFEEIGKFIGAGIWQGFKAAMLGWEDPKPSKYNMNSSQDAGTSAREGFSAGLSSWWNDSHVASDWWNKSHVGSDLVSATGKVGRDLGVGLKLIDPVALPKPIDMQRPTSGSGVLNREVSEEVSTDIMRMISTNLKRALDNDGANDEQTRDLRRAGGRMGATP